MKALHLMWDLETQDTIPSAIVVSIGACLFDPNSGFISDKLFYAVLDRDVQLLRGRTQSEATMSWWAAQSPEARSVFDKPTTHPRQALVDLADYMQAQEIGGVWGNGAAFDNVMMADLYRSFGVAPPWPFWKDRCHRTMKALAESTIEGFAGVKREGTHHNALDDAIHQARYLQTAVKALGLRV